MGGRRRSGRESRDGEGLGVVQSDLSMNIFMIFVVMLSVLSVSAGITGKAGFLSPAARESDAAPAGLGAAWNPVQPLNPRFLVRDDVLHRLDFRALARVVVAGGALAIPDERFQDITTLEAKDPDPSAFWLRVRGPGVAPPDEIVAYRVPVADLAAGVTAPSPMEVELERTGSIDLLYAEADAEAAWRVMRYMASRHVRVRPVYQRYDDTIEVLRATDRFAFQDTYK